MQLINVCSLYLLNSLEFYVLNTIRDKLSLFRIQVTAIQFDNYKMQFYKL
jgi:hypothetical protein